MIVKYAEKSGEFGDLKEMIVKNTEKSGDFGDLRKSNCKRYRKVRRI